MEWGCVYGLRTNPMACGVNTALSFALYRIRRRAKAPQAEEDAEKPMSGGGQETPATAGRETGGTDSRPYWTVPCGRSRRRSSAQATAFCA